MDKYFYPIPKDKLITRFKPVFDQLSKTRNVTLLALPFAGRSSHLRFIATQPKVQTELGVLFTKKIIWTESENYSDFGQFISQICISIDSTNTNHSSILSRDVFLIQTLLKSIIKSQGEIILIISLGRLNQALAPDIEQLFTLLQKENPNLKILWSIDTTIFRNYSPKHASCSLLENIYYFPTFNLEETRHSLERISRAKQKKLSKALKDICLNETGGLAGLFHLCLFRQNQTNEIINTVQRELTLCPELSVHLTTLEFRQFLASKFSQTFSYKHINLNRLPTAQEINLLNLFLEKENRPTTRDEVAETIWGKKWQEKYSDWAIDKAISRLRENLNSEIHKLITIKSLGYTLICNQN